MEKYRKEQKQKHKHHHHHHDHHHHDSDHENENDTEKNQDNPPRLTRHQATMMQFAAKMGYESAQELETEMASPRNLLQRKFKRYKRYGDTSIDVIVQDMLQDYNFIAVMERMDESLVVFQMLFGLSTQEILYTKARSSGTFSNGPSVDRPCVYILKPSLTPGMQDYFASPEWKELAAEDERIFQAANASLDRTIDALGRDAFDAKMREFQAALVLAQQQCEGRVHGMCNARGNPIPFRKRTCYIWAEGCDHQCLNDLEF
uniref:Uncharacterized protein n=1 Tax=Craspedostauros australis TaxID=1486917 RepID=A0A7R9ZJS0_9STRA